MKPNKIAEKLARIDHRDTAMRYVWRNGRILKDVRVTVETVYDLAKLGSDLYRIAQPEEHFGDHRFLTIELKNIQYWFHLHHGMCMHYRITTF